MVSRNVMTIIECFDVIKRSNGNKNIEEDYLEKVSARLKYGNNIEASFKIIKDDQDQFFGMRVFPVVDVVDEIVKEILDKDKKSTYISNIWRNNRKWVIEIDEKLIYSPDLNMTASEITAVLFHEIGHVVYNTRIPQKLTEIIRYTMIKFPIEIQKVAAHKRFRGILGFAVASACNAKWIYAIGRKEEYYADNYAVKMGLGEELSSAMSKTRIFMENSTLEEIIRDDDADVKAAVNYLFLTMKEFSVRKTKLRTVLRTEVLKTPSAYIKDLADSIYHKVFGKNNDRYQDLVSESLGIKGSPYNDCVELENAQKIYDFIITEAKNSIFDSMGKAPKITQNDIDILAVETEKIQDSDDKIYLLDRVHMYSETIDRSLYLIETGRGNKVPQSKSSLISLQSQLKDIRKEILATKPIEKDYGVFIKYPKGYEG